MRWSKLGAPLYLMNILLFIMFLITLNVTAYLTPAPFMISPENGNVCETGEVALKDDPLGDSTSWYCYSCPSLNHLSVLLLVLSAIRQLI